MVLVEQVQARMSWGCLECLLKRDEDDGVLVRLASSSFRGRSRTATEGIARESV
jgi:hypothetical protein